MEEAQPTDLEEFLMHLTREEFKTLFALIQLDHTEEFEGCIGLPAYRTPNELGEDDHCWLENLRRAARFLTECDHPFDNLICHDNGSITPKFSYRDPKMTLYAIALAEGRGIDYIDAFSTAIELGRELPGFPANHLRECLGEMVRSVEHVKSSMDPEELKEWEKFSDRALESVGIKRFRGSIQVS